MKNGILVRNGKIVAEMPIIRGKPYQAPVVPEVRRSWFYGMSSWQLVTLKLTAGVIGTAIIVLVIKEGPKIRSLSTSVSKSPQHQM